MSVLILLPPSEGKTPAKRGRPLDLVSLSFPELTDTRQEVIDALAVASIEPDAARTVGGNANLRDEVERNLKIRTAPSAAAASVYTGVLYQALDYAGLDAPAKRRANRWIAVVSAAYGAVRLSDRIAAYRVQTCAELPEVGHVAKRWRQSLAAGLDPVAVPGKLIVDCRSTTYATLWRPTGKAADRWVTISVPGASHMAKHTRGLVARAICELPTEPRHPVALAEALSPSFRVELTEPPRSGAAWNLAVHPPA